MDAFVQQARTKFSANAQFEGWSPAHEAALSAISRRGFVCRRDMVQMYSGGLVSSTRYNVTAVHFLCLLAAGRSASAPESTSPPRLPTETVDWDAQE